MENIASHNIKQSYFHFTNVKQVGPTVFTKSPYVKCSRVS